MKPPGLTFIWEDVIYPLFYSQNFYCSCWAKGVITHLIWSDCTIPYLFHLFGRMLWSSGNVLDLAETSHSFLWTQGEKKMTGWTLSVCSGLIDVCFQESTQPIVQKWNYWLTAAIADVWLNMSADETARHRCFCSLLVLDQRSKAWGSDA